MNTPRSAPITERRLARLIAWTLLVLAWIAAFMFDREFRPGARRLHRFAFLSLPALKRCVRNLIVVRAALLLPARPERARRNHAPAGFTRRLEPRQALRSIAGARLRRALRARAPGELISVLIAALRDIDTLARAIAYPRTRLAPMLIVRPPRAALHTRPAPQPCAINSS